MSNGIFGLASRHAEWVGQRRTVVAANVAHANTPGYRAADVAPFAGLLVDRANALARTHQRHLAPPHAEATFDQQDIGTDGAQHSGNTVDLEQEMLKTGEVTRAHMLNAAIVKAFHRMSLVAAKGGS